MKYEIADSNNSEIADTFQDAIRLIAEWYEDSDQWATGNGDPETHQTIREAIVGVDSPDDGDIDDLSKYAREICQAVAEAMGNSDFAGHGNYYVTAADRGGYSLTVSEITDPR